MAGRSDVMTTHIPPEEIQFHPTSFCDRNGRLFSWRGGLYRALTPQGAALGQRLFSSGVVAELVQSGLLIDTELTDLTLEGWPAVVQHRRLPFISFPYEWSGRMLRDAAVLIADLELALRARGFALNVNDLTPSNVLFDGCRPVYIDFGSIRDAGDLPGRAYEDFLNSCAFPAKLAALGQAPLARMLLRPQNGLSLDDLAALERSLHSASRPQKTPALLQRLLSPLASTRSQRNRLPNLKQAKAEIEQLDIPLAAASNHQADPAIEQSLRQLAHELNPVSALLLGPVSDPLVSTFLDHGCQVIVAAPDDSTIDRQYSFARPDPGSLLPLVLDPRYPTPGLGVANREYASAFERLACEMVVAQDVVTSLVFDHYLNFDQIATTLSLWTRRWLAVEFVFPENAALRPRCEEPFYAWYGLDGFRASLATHFASVEIRASSADAHCLLLCTR